MREKKFIIIMVIVELASLVVFRSREMVSLFGLWAIISLFIFMASILKYDENKTFSAIIGSSKGTQFTIRNVMSQLSKPIFFYLYLGIVNGLITFMLL